MAGPGHHVPSFPFEEATIAELQAAMTSVGPCTASPQAEAPPAWTTPPTPRPWPPPSAWPPRASTRPWPGSTWTPSSASPTAHRGSGSSWPAAPAPPGQACLRQGRAPGPRRAVPEPAEGGRAL